MENEKLFTGIVLVFLGGLNIISPEILINFRIWMAKAIYGAEFKPTKRTLKVQQITGVLFFILGLLVLTNII